MHKKERYFKSGLWVGTKFMILKEPWKMCDESRIKMLKKSEHSKYIIPMFTIKCFKTSVLIIPWPCLSKTLKAILQRKSWCMLHDDCMHKAQQRSVDWCEVEDIWWMKCFFLTIQKRFETGQTDFLKCNLFWMDESFIIHATFSPSIIF